MTTRDEVGQITRGTTNAHRLTVGLAALGVICGAVLSAYVLIYVLNLGLINNGDGDRLLRSALVPYDKGAEHLPLPASFPMQPLASAGFHQFVPQSPAGAIVMVIALISRLFGADRFYMVGLTSVYFAMFYAGGLLLFGALQSLGSRVAAILVCAFFLLNPYLVAYFFSLYEESFVLALVPLWCYLAIQAFQFEKQCGLFLLATLAVVASKASFIVLLMAPAVLCLHHRKLKYALAALFVFAGALGALAKYERLFDTPNSFDRLYNGLAFSLADVSQWPSRDSVARGDQAPAWVRPEQFHETGLPEFALQEWGHFYYGDAHTESPEEMMAYVRLGQKPAFLKLLASHPHFAFKLIEQSIGTAIVADYTQSYHQQPNATDAVPKYQAIFRAAQINLGLLFVAAILLLAWRPQMSNPFATVLLLAGLVSPVAVVLGDGYSEFERHLLPFLVLILFSIPLLELRRGTRWRA